MKTLAITYLFESTTLWGGNKVALEQAEALSEIGHKITIISKDSGPSWYPLTLRVSEVPHFDSSTIPASDILIGTYWPTVKAAYESGKGLPVHLCQGYEAANIELFSQKKAIDEVYSYRIPKLVVSPHLASFLQERFQSETYYVGHMLNRNIFYPPKDSPAEKNKSTFTILIVGPFEADVKNIRTVLKGVLLAKSNVPVRLNIVRASQFQLSPEEESILKPDSYLFHIPYQKMGDIYRKADLLISMSKEAEGFGLPALEAMGCGVPTILSRISSYTSFDQPQDYTLFVDVNDSEGLANAIAEVYHNTALRNRIINRGLATAKLFTKQRVMQRFMSALESIVNRNALLKYGK